MNSSNKERILIVAAHPDDEVLGCGATMAKYARAGHSVFTLILGEGVAARGVSAAQLHKQTQALRQQSETANRLLGVKKVYRHAFPDNQFDALPLLEIVKVIEDVKKEVRPTMLFTHHAHDVNVDHVATFKACLAAFRPLPGEALKQFYSFYTLSSTDWQAPLAGQMFAPSVYIGVEKTLSLKVRALQAYRSEIRPYPHPRSAKGLVIEAQRSGLRIGVKAAESFELIRHVEL